MSGYRLSQQPSSVCCGRNTAFPGEYIDLEHCSTLQALILDQAYWYLDGIGGLFMRNLNLESLYQYTLLRPQMAALRGGGHLHNFGHLYNN